MIAESCVVDSFWEAAFYAFAYMGLIVSFLTALIWWKTR